jgi:trimeric autotransporter adhesin
MMKRRWGIITATSVSSLVMSAVVRSQFGPPVEQAFVLVDQNAGNVAGGPGALAQNDTGTSNTAFASFALFGNTTGVNNTAVGASAMRQNTGGSNNTAVGAAAMHGSTENPRVTGAFNTAVGARALESNLTGSGNVAMGFFALSNERTGSSNIAVGREALGSAVSGLSNIAIGPRAGRNLQSGNFNIYIGADVGEINESGTIRIGDTSRYSGTFIGGIARVNVTNGSEVVINSRTGQLGIVASSGRYKRDVKSMGGRSKDLLRLRPVTFSYKEDAQRERQYGLIAEEVVKVFPELVTRGPTGEVESVRYHEFAPMLLNELQRQQTQIEAQTRQLNLLKARNLQLQRVIQQKDERDAAILARLASLEAATAHNTTRGQP